MYVEKPQSCGWNRSVRGDFNFSNKYIPIKQIIHIVFREKI